MRIPTLISRLPTRQLWTIEYHCFKNHFKIHTMKTTHNFRILLALVFTLMGSAASQAQAYQQQENWLHAWKSFAGAGYASTWLLDATAEGAVVYANNTSGILLLETPSDWAGMDEAIEGLEEGIQSGNGNQMRLMRSVKQVNNELALAQWGGNLGGKPCFAAVTAVIGDDGSARCVIELSLLPPAMEDQLSVEHAMATLHQLPSQPHVSPALLHASTTAQHSAH